MSFTASLAIVNLQGSRVHVDTVRTTNPKHVWHQQSVTRGKPHNLETVVEGEAGWT